MNDPQSRRCVRIGMVGVGGFGAVRRRSLQQAGCFKLVSLCDRNRDVLEEACCHEQARPVASFEDLVSDPAIEAVVISTGIDTHAEFTLKALAAGNHVFVEKPVCGTLREATELRAAAQSAGCVVMVGHHDNATDPVIRVASKWVESGKLGSIVSYQVNTSHSGGLEIQPGDWRGSPERNPGGMLLQCGVHSLHRVNHLFGPIAAVASMMRRDVNPATRTVDAANVLLRHHNGVLGTLNCYHVTAYCHELRIFGTRGTLSIDTHALQAWFQRRRCQEAESPEPVEVPAPSAQDRCANVINWHSAIVAGTAPKPSLEDGIAAILPVFAAERAADQSCEVELKSMGLESEGQGTQ